MASSIPIHPLEFNVPDNCRLFTLFPRLPPELREQIWIEAVSAPRMHFVKLESRCMSWRWASLTRTPLQHAMPSTFGNADDNDEIAAQVRHEADPKPMRGVHLVPIAPDKRSDISCHNHLQQRLLDLSLTCKESLGAMRSLVYRPGTLRLGDHSILSMAGSTDIVYLEYFPPELYETGCGLAIDPNCPDLDVIRRVAVRFSHHWQNKSAASVCIFCGQVHNTTPRRPVFPTHLYHFMARHLPNLEELYFVDYLIVRRPRPRCKRGDRPLAIPCGNRTFFEATPDEWCIKPQVLSLTSWLQDRFVRYAETSRLSRHRNPKSVRFGILACEHHIPPPVSLQTRQTLAQASQQAHRRRRKDAGGRGRYSFQRIRPSGVRLSEAKERAPIRMEADVPLLFGNGGKDSFEFTFRV